MRIITASAERQGKTDSVDASPYCSWKSGEILPLKWEIAEAQSLGRSHDNRKLDDLPAMRRAGEFLESCKSV